MRWPDEIKLETLSVAIGLAITASYLASIVYEWAFLRYFGLGYAQVPINFYDISKAALSYFPLLCVATTFNLASYQLNSRLGREYFDSETKSLGEFIHKRLFHPILVLRISYMLLIFGYAVNGDADHFLLINGLVLISLDIVGSIYLFYEPRFSKYRSILLIVAVVVFGIAQIYNWGYDSAEKVDVSQARQALKLQGGEIRFIKIARIYNSGVLFISGKNLNYIPNSYISEIDYGESVHRVGLPCYFAGLRCP